MNLEIPKPLVLAIIFCSACAVSAGPPEAYTYPDYSYYNYGYSSMNPYDEFPPYTTYPWDYGVDVDLRHGWGHGWHGHHGGHGGGGRWVGHTGGHGGGHH